MNTPTIPTPDHTRTSDDFCTATCIYPTGKHRKGGSLKTRVVDIETAKHKLQTGTRATVNNEDAPAVLAWLTQKATEDHAAHTTPH